MKLRTTLLLLLVTGGLLAYIFLHERRQPPRDLAGFLLFDLHGDVLRDEVVKPEIVPDDIGGIDLKSASGDIAFRRSEDGSWEMARGLKDRASREDIRTLLDFVAKAKILDTLDHEEVSSGRVKDSSIGMDDAGSVELTFRKPGGGRLVELRIGRTAPLGQAMYVRFNGEKSREDIYIVNPDLREFLTRPPDQFRDRNVSKYPSERIRKFTVKRGEGEIEFSRASTNEADGEPWVISKPLQNAAADQAVVGELLGAITGAKIAEFSPGTTGGSSTAPAGQMLAEVTLWPDGAYDRKGISLVFYPDPDPASKLAVCRDRERKAEFRVSRELVDFLELVDGPGTFREAKLGNIDPARVTSVEVEIPGGDSVGLYHVGERWVMRRKGTEELQAASGEAVQKLIKSVNEAEVLEFATDALTDKTLWGLENPAVTLTFATGKHTSLRQLAAVTTDNSRVLRLGILSDGKVYANFAGEPFVYRVGPELAGLVPRQMIRWRTLQLPGFARVSLRGIRQILGAAPPVSLAAAPNSFVWTAERAGEDVTSMLDQAKAEALAARLANLQVNSWQGEADASLKSLEAAPIVLEYECELPGEKGGAPRAQRVKLEFAPMNNSPQAPLCYGRHSLVPGVFLIDTKTVRELAVPLLKTPVP